MSPTGSLTLGEFLRQEREKNGVTIEQVASATKISVKHLHALEADQYVDLPAKPFIRGFVNSYVRFIGLDPKEVLTAYGDFIDQKALERPSREGGHSGYAFEKREGEQSRTVLWLVMGGFLVIGAVIYIFLRPSLHHKRASHVEKLRSAHGPVASPSPMAMPAPSPEAVVAPAVPSPAPSPSPSPSPFASPSPSTKPAANDPLNSGTDLLPDEVKHKVIFRALNDVWVRYQVDEKKAMRFILRKDRVLVLRAKSSIRFQTSDPNSVRFAPQGKTAKLMAEEKSAASRQGDLTLFFPTEVAESIKEPFPGSKPVTGMPVPASGQPSPSPTATP